MSISEKSRFFAIIALVLVGAPNSVLAACEGLRILSLTSSQNFEYDIYSNEIHLSTLSYEIKKDSGTCRYYLLADTENSSSPHHRSLINSDKTLSYSLNLNPFNHSPIAEYPSKESGETLSGIFSGSGFQTHQETIYLRINQNQEVFYGDYNDHITLHLFETPDQEAVGQEVHLKSIPFSIHVSKQVHLSFENTPHGSNFKQIDFGLLAPGLQERVNLYSFSNTPHTIEIQSVNGGFLRSPDFPSTNQQIPYTLKVDGTTFDPRTTNLINNSFTTNITRRQHRFDIAIGDYSETLKPGYYEDNLVVTIRAK